MLNAGVFFLAAAPEGMRINRRRLHYKFSPFIAPGIMGEWGARTARNHIPGERKKDGGHARTHTDTRKHMEGGKHARVRDGCGIHFLNGKPTRAAEFIY